MNEDFLAWMAIGLVAGLLTRAAFLGRDPGGALLAVLLGIAGALFAGFCGQAARLYGTGAPAGYLAAALGAVALVLVYRLVMRRRRRRP